MNIISNETKYNSTANFLVWLVCQSILLLSLEVPGSTCENGAVCSWIHMCGVSSDILQPFCWDDGLFQKFSHTALGQCFLCMAKNIKLCQQLGKFLYKQQICYCKCMVTRVKAVVLCFSGAVGSKWDMSYRKIIGSVVDQEQHVEKICEVWMHFTHQLYFAHQLYCHNSASIT